MLAVHKIALSPNKQQIQHFAQAAGVARFSYNWALAEWKRQYEVGDKPSEAGLRKQLNAIKSVDFPWMLDVSKAVPQQAIKNLGQAFTNYFRGLKRGDGPAGYPKFKKKGRSKDSFRIDNGPPRKGDNAVRVDGKRIKLPRIGWVRMTEEVRFPGQIKSATISRTADRWFVALAIDADKLPNERKNHGSIGVDLGIKHLAVLSDGRKIDGPKALSKELRKLRRLSRWHSRKKRGSANRRKSAMKLAGLHARITNIRSDSLHKLTTDIVLNNTFIGIEDLNVRGMMQNRKLARHISDAGFNEFRRQLGYKASWYGANVVAIDRWFPSSKLCHQCGEVKTDMKLSDRIFRCKCGYVADRDVNAARNIVRQALAEFTPVETQALTV